MSETTADLIIVGGGLTGCALASRLAEKHPSLSIVLLEAGGDHRGDERTTSFTGGLSLLNSSLDWAYKTAAQANTAGREHTINSGKALGGGSVINLGGWSRGDARDYDEWASVVGDESWSYAGLLPTFQKVESYFDANASRAHHGFEGPIHVTAVSASDPKRNYGLREPLRAAWREAGVPFNADPALGQLAGLSDYLENWHHGKRQPAYLAYSLASVQVVTAAVVARVLFSSSEETPVATGVSLDDGRVFHARKEVILCAGALKTPQILMLSGIGSRGSLAKHDITLVHELPDVGCNMIDHFCLYQLWMLQDPEKNYAHGSPAFKEPAYFSGLPADWAMNEGIPHAALQAALDKDGDQDGRLPTGARGLLSPGKERSLFEAVVVYSTLGLPGVPIDGSIVTSSLMLLHPVSRGVVELASGSVNDAPRIDPHYYSAETDRAVMVQGVRRVLQALLGTPTGKSLFRAEVPFPGLPSLSPHSSDAEIDERIRATGLAQYHSAGTAAMGKVVNSKLQVYGVKGLRVADASVFPVSIGAHPQATLYALAERAADIVSTGL